jgi:2Fe-2S ferredoxin
MRIEIPKLGRVIENVPANANLLTVLSMVGVPIARSCAGDGVCGTCAISLTGEGIPPMSSFEKKLLMKQNKDSRLRIACLIKIPELSKTWVVDATYW